MPRWHTAQKFEAHDNPDYAPNKAKPKKPNGGRLTTPAVVPWDALGVTGRRDVPANWTPDPDSIQAQRGANGGRILRNQYTDDMTYCPPTTPPLQRTRASIRGHNGLPSAAAIISDCTLYRYQLLRNWDHRLSVVCWVMLNPSTADGIADDPTVRRCVAYAKAWGFGGIEVVNLFAYRTPDPSVLAQAARAGTDIVGPDNDRYVTEAAKNAGRVMAAWGANAARGGFARRADAVVRMLLRAGVRPSCLKLCGDGVTPVHPLMQRADLTPSPLPLRKTCHPNGEPE